MNNNNKNQVGHDIVCRSHSARSERDLYRVCPSKLNKRELEDLYFALLENNLELKRTINGQREKIKVLSTKVQRMSTAQKGSFGRESRECCLTTKAVVNEQKDTIAELKKSNERMTERIRLLNMRLCSAKQFVKRSPTQSTTRCVKCSTQPAGSPKNSSTIALNTNTSETNLKATAVSCHELIEKDNMITTTRSMQTETNDQCEKEDSAKPCNENKCRTLMEELKQKIVNLQEELSSTHSEYSSRIGRLENEVTSLQVRDKDTQDIASRLTRAELRNGELAMELSIERGKVAELETSVRAANLSSKVAATIEGHLANINQARRESYSRTLPLCSPCCPAEWEQRSPKMHQSTPTKVVSSVEVVTVDNYDTKNMINSDDSGYTDANKSSELPDDKGLNKVNEELMKKIVDLQTKLDEIQVSTISQTVLNGKPTVAPNNSEESAKDKADDVSEYIINHDCVIIQPDKDVIPEPTINIVDITRSDLNTEQSTSNTPPVIKIMSSTTIPTAKYPLVWMNEGQKNLEDTDDGSFTIKPSDKPPTPEEKLEVEPSKDNHNRFQIPGPIPSDTNTRRHARRRSNAKKERQMSKEDVTLVKETDCQEIVKNHKDEAIVNFDNVIHDTDDASVKFIDVKRKKDSIELSRLRLERKVSKNASDDMPAIEEKTYDMIPMVEEEKAVPNEREPSLTNYYVDPMKSTRKLSIDEHRTEPEKKHVQLGTQMEYQTAVEPCPPYKNSVMNVPATYTVEDKSGASDKDTDHEISAMTDLPTERDDNSPAETLSPGEHKYTSTGTGTGAGTGARSHSTTTDYGTLSEGELPTLGRVRRLSVGERPTTDVIPSAHRKSSHQKMEEALHAITEELARCKQLLLTQRQHQVKCLTTIM